MPSIFPLLVDEPEIKIFSKHSKNAPKIPRMTNANAGLESFRVAILLIGIKLGIPVPLTIHAMIAAPHNEPK